MSFNYFVDVFHTVLSDFRGLSIEDFNYFLRTRETFAGSFQEYSCHIVFNIGVEERVEPNDLSFLGFFLLFDCLSAIFLRCFFDEF